jgi:hypothetical protein
VLLSVVVGLSKRLSDRRSIDDIMMVDTVERSETVVIMDTIYIIYINIILYETSKPVGRRGCCQR